MDGPVQDLPNPSQHASKEDKGLGYIVILLQVPSRTRYTRLREGGARFTAGTLAII